MEHEEGCENNILTSVQRHRPRKSRIRIRSHHRIIAATNATSSGFPIVAPNGYFPFLLDLLTRPYENAQYLIYLEEYSSFEITLTDLDEVFIDVISLRREI